MARDDGGAAARFGAPGAAEALGALKAAGAAGAAGQRCNRPHCGLGVVDEQGFCPECGLRPLTPVPDAAAGAPGRPAAPSTASTGVANARSDPWYGLGLAEAGESPDTLDAPVVHPGPVDERHRFCGNPACGKPVGRGQDGAAGRTAGFCPNCGTRFDFTQPSGLTIAGRYEVKRYLGAGAYGAAFLAHDRNLATDVVLKKLSNTAVAVTAHAERDVLVGLRHDSIVRVLGYEDEGPHLVLEYIPGAPLSARPTDRLEFLLAHGVRVLQALDYLHGRELLHCDVKPLNIIRFREESPAGPHDRVRLIDFGSVRALKDTSPVTAYTGLYAPEPEDPEHTAPTPGFDLYCLGTTLEEVCRAYLAERTAPGIDSLHLLLDRATDDDVPSRRFVSARQFGEQLSGVIRQVVAAPPLLRQVARPSPLFGPVLDPLHGGLGAPRPLDDWVTAVLAEEPGGAGEGGGAALTLPPAFAAPPPPAIAAALPAPLGDPDEPGLAAAESALAASRIALRRGDPDQARYALAGARLPLWHWLHSWYSGLIALARDHADDAAAHFTAVRDALPGDLVPLLALGLCAETRGDLEVARARYAAVFGTTPALGAAGFGLARVHLLAGRRAMAVEALERLAPEFRYGREAGVAAVRALVTAAGAGSAAGGAPGAARGGPGAGPERRAASPAVPADADLARALEALDRLDVDAAQAAGLRAEIQYARFLRTGDRLTLSETVRALGPHATTARDFTALVDLANDLRPPVAWRRLLRRGRAGRSHTGEMSGTVHS